MNSKTKQQSMQAKLVIFPNGQTEVGTGGPGYRWVSAYSIKYADGCVSCPMTLSNLRGMAKRDGNKLIKCQNEGEAAAAVASVQ